MSSGSDPAVQVIEELLAGAEYTVAHAAGTPRGDTAAARAASYRDALAKLATPAPTPFLFLDSGHKPHSVATKQEAIDLLFDADFYGAVWEWVEGEWLREG